MKEQKSLKNVFTGVLDMDTEIRSVKENNYVDAVNIRNGKNRNGNYGMVSNMNGTLLAPYSQTGTNKSIGTLENKSNNLNYYFVWNDNGDMEIREFNVLTNEVKLIVRYDFGWEADKYVSNSDIIDNKLLMWTDRIPRRINIEKSRPDKQHKGNIYFTSPNSPFTPAVTSFTIVVLDQLGNVIAIDGTANPLPLTKKETADFITDFINDPLNGLSNLCTAESCEDAVEVTFIQEGYFALDVFVNNNVGSIYVPQNYYFSITDTIVDAGKYPLNCAPTLQIKQDNERVGFNNIERTTWQFATQVIYDDFDRSTLSPFSDIAFINCEQRGNYIEVNFTDPRLNNETDLSIIASVRILGRPGNNAKWRIIETISQGELWANSGAIGTNTYRFYNDGQYTVIDDAEAELAYSAMPIDVINEKYDMTEESFDNRVGYGDFRENYEAPCIEASLTPEFTELNDRSFVIGGNILIYNPNQFNLGGGVGAPGFIGAIHQPDQDNPPVFGGANSMSVNTDTGSIGGQYLMSGGFPVFLAGTPHLAISQQNRLPSGQYGSNNVFDTTTQAGRDSLEAIYEEYNNTGGASGFPFSIFELKNVKAGKYVLSIASHLCSFGGENYGSYYDLNGNLYQKTSTFFKSVNIWNGSSFGGELACKEITIDIRESGQYTISVNGTVIQAGVAGSNNDIFIGNFNIEDIATRIATTIALSPTTSFRTVANIWGYLIDAESSSLIQDVAKGVSMEKQLVLIQTETTSQTWNKFPVFPAGPKITTSFFDIKQTDRNGFFYTSGQELIEVPPNNSTEVRVSYTYKIRALSVNAGTPSPLVIRDLIDDYYYSDSTSILLEIEQQSATKGQYVKNYVDTPVSSNLGVIAYSSNSQVSALCRTLITGRVVDSNGQGLEGITVSFEYTNRVERTQADGTFSILVYGDYFSVGNNSRLNWIILSSCCDCKVLFAGSGTETFTAYLTLTPFGIGGLNSNVPFAPLILNDVVCDILRQFIRHLKSGGRYNFALFYVDELNRRHALVTNNLEIEIPFLTEQRQDYFDNVGTGQSNGIFEFTLNVTSPPPPWADKLYVCRTKDTYYSDYLQFPLFDAKYVVQYDDENSLPIETTYSTFSATEIYLGFPQSTIAYKEFNSASKKGWTFQEGDRVRFISKPNGSLYPQLFDLPIKAQRIDSVSEFIYYAIDNLDALEEVTAGTLVEIYRPKKQLEDEVQRFFEIHACIDIQNGQHVGLPLKLSTGDTYSRNRTSPIESGISSNFIEDNSISDNWISDQQDVGRVIIKTEDFGELKRYNAIRFSNQYIPGSRINGLSRFEPLNVVEFPRQYGAIQKTILVNDNAERQVILTVCENNSFTIYVGEAILSDLRGGDLIALSNKVLGAYRTLKGDYGTKNPESFSFIDGQVFFWDVNRKHRVRYDNNGLDAISKLGARTYFLGINEGTDVISVYDDFYEEDIVYPKQDDKLAIGYNSEKRGWNGKYDFKPEMFGAAGEFIISFVDGDLYVHDKGNVNEFYGIKYNSRITFSSNQFPLLIKMAYAVLVKASNIWYIPENGIITEPNSMYLQGMVSELLKGHWENAEGDWWGALLKDKNDPNPTLPTIAEKLLRGRTLRSQAFKVTLETDSDNIESLRSAELFIYQSENTN
jgi:hypothetical protein